LIILPCCLLSFFETSYTYDKPDTPENKKGFERHFGFSPPSDVTELYYYVDELGIDAKYQLGFKANRSTIDKIISNLDLKMESGIAESIATEFSWWQRSDLKNLKPYWKQSDNGRYFRYLWYDEQKKQVWYLEFDT
jgi:hypothetical protein